MFVPLGLNAYETNEYGLPPIVLENLYAEKAPDNNLRSARLLPTPGAVNIKSAQSFSGQYGALYQSDGVISGELIVQVGTAVYRLDSDGNSTTLTGAVTAKDKIPAQFASTQTPELVLVCGDTAYLVDSANVTSLHGGGGWAGPTAGNITSVDVLGQRHFFTEAGTGRVWFSDSADATTVQATSFVTAEGDPDEAKAIKVYGTTGFVFGSRKTEAIYLTGDATTPVAFRPNNAFDIGIRSSRAVTNIQDGLAFVGHDSQVYLLRGGRPSPIGTTPIVKAITALKSETDTENLALGFYSQEGHNFIVVHIPNYGDMFYDTTTGLWHRRKHVGNTFSGIGPVTAAFRGANIYALDNRDDSTTRVLRIRTDRYKFNSESVRRVATALVHLEDGVTQIKSLTVEGQIGEWSLDPSDEPELMLRIAEDGFTFKSEITRVMAKMGEYRRRVVFSPLGLAQPGPVRVEVAYTEDIPYSMTGLLVNNQVVR